MKAVLFFPPGGSIQQPYTSLPALCAFLRMHDMHVLQFDLGIEAVKHYINTSRLARAISQIEQKLKEQAENPDPKYYFAMEEAIVFGPDVLKNIEEAKKNLQTMATYHDYKKYTWSRNNFTNAVKLICVEYSQPWAGFVVDQGTKLSESHNNLSPAILDNHLFSEFYNAFIDQNFSDTNAPGLTGISVTYNHQLIPSLILAAHLRKRFPRMHITFGGAFLTSLLAKLPEPGQCIPFFEYVDSLIAGDGETALLRLCEKIEQKDEDWSDIPNIVYKKNGECIRGKEKRLEPLNEMPTPDYDGLPMVDYLSPKPVILLANSRGCYWNKCAFCELTGLAEKKYRFRKLELVFRDLETLAAKHNTEYFLFSVEAIPPNQLKEICEYILSRNLKIYWQSEVRFEKQFTDDFCRLLYRAGCRQLIFGLESGNQRILDLMEKGTKLSEIREIMKNCHGAGIAVSLQSFIGFPTETESEATDTLNFLLENRDLINSFAMGKYKLIIHSRVYNNPQAYGIQSIVPCESKLFSENNYSLVTANYVALSSLSETEKDALHKKFMTILEENYSAELANNPIEVHTLVFLSLHGADFFQAHSSRGKLIRKKLLQCFFNGNNSIYPLLSSHVSLKKIVLRTSNLESGQEHILLAYNHLTGKISLLSKFWEIEKLRMLVNGYDNLNKVIKNIQTAYPVQTGLKSLFELINHDIINQDSLVIRL